MTTDTPIILLDLNHTLADNSHEVVIYGRAYNVAIERYRTWLIDMLRDHHVILITVRPQRYREETMARIKAQTGWQPDEAYFNEWGTRAPETKARILATSVFPRYGTPTTTSYVALESNDATAAMYAAHGIPRYRAKDVRGRPELLRGEPMPEQSTLF